MSHFLPVIQSVTEDSDQITLPCVHCGKAQMVAADVDPQQVFCCNGCRSAFELIQGLELDQFYDLRDQMGSSGTSPGQKHERGFEVFDDPKRLGFSAPKELPDGLMETVLALQGLHCGACAWLIENAASRTPGWIDARVQMNNHTIRIVYDPSQTTLGTIARTLVQLGYQPVALTKSDQDAAQLENRNLLVQIAIAGFCAANAMWIAIALYAAEASGVISAHYHFLRWSSAFLGVFAVAGPGRSFFRGAMASIKTRTPHMDLPVALGLLVGTIVGMFNVIFGGGAVYFDSLAVLVFLLLIGRWIQFRQQHRAAKAVDLMLRITPNHAKRLFDDGTTDFVEVSTLTPGDVVRVAAGDSVPVDGVIQSGSTTIDQSLLTGESAPVATKVGDEVFAGTLNQLSPIDVRVTATSDESRIGKVMQLVETAAISKTPIVQLADKIGGVFVVTVTLLAIGTFMFWMSDGWQLAAEHATALLIVACPCALALATPLAIAVALGRSAKRQILIRDGSLLQRLSRPGMIWFDKTGTLTVGQPQVALAFGKDVDRALRLAAAIEKDCTHPLADGIVAEAKRRNLRIPPTSGDTTAHLGGIRGKVSGKDVCVGNFSFMNDNHASLDEAFNASIREVENDGMAPILVSIDGRVVAVLAMADQLRDDASQLIAQLEMDGWQIGILSGDNVNVVNRIARELGLSVDKAHGQLSPEEKLSTIRNSQKEGIPMVMVGDGANDAAALAAADVGIAIRGGAEVSLQAAPIYVASGRLSSIFDLMAGAKSTTQLIYTTFAVSLCYNLIAVVLAATGNISPLIAALLMPISSVSVLAITLAWPTFQRTSV